MRLSLDQARRIALGAQGLTTPRPGGRVDVRHFRRVLDAVGIVQIDSVNVCIQSHYMPFFARLGPYDRDALDHWLNHSDDAFEYWGHEASFMPMERYPMLTHRMAARKPWRRVAALIEEHPEYLEQVYRQVSERGPISVSDLHDAGDRNGPWWGWGPGKIALEWLFATGRILGRRGTNLLRYYDLPERIIPAEILNRKGAPAEEAYKELLVDGARHHGMGTADDLVDYFRLRPPLAKPLLAGLLADGRLLEARVEGWKQPVYVHPEAARPRSVKATTLLSPFDSVVWYRPRAERLFDFHYRIEIYVPKEKRIHGYYVMPFMLDGRLVARVDLKADRKGGALTIPGAFAEEGAPAETSVALAAELATMAGWLGLGDVRVGRKGNLATQLRKAVG